MSVFTELHIGLANAWIGTLIIFIVMMAPLINKDVARRMMDMSWYTPRERKIARASLVLLYGMAILTIWVPLKR